VRLVGAERTDLVECRQTQRRWLPFVYFSRLERYEDLAAAWPLIVYQTSLPCQSKTLTYDVQDIESTREALNSAIPALTTELTRIRQLVQQKGNKRAAEFYDPGQAAGPRLGLGPTPV
jgi:hypothetical protein